MIQHRAVVVILGLAALALAAAITGTDGAGAQTSNDIVVDVGGLTYALEPHDAAGQVFVSVPTENAVIALDAATGAEVTRRTFSSPHGLDMSIGGSALYVALGDTDGVGVWDLSTGVTSIIPVPALAGMESRQILHAATDLVVVSGTGSLAPIVAVELATGATFPINNNENYGPLALAAHGDLLYASSIDHVFVFDLSDPAITLLHERSALAAPAVQRPILSDDGSIMILGGGRRVETATWRQTGLFTAGFHAFGADGNLYAYHHFDESAGPTRDSGSIQQHDPVTRQRLGESLDPCAFTIRTRASDFVALSNGGFAVGGASEVCLTGMLQLTVPYTGLDDTGPVAELGALPTAAVVDDVTRRAFVAVPVADAVVVIDLDTGDVLERRFFPYPVDIALAPDGSVLYVGLRGSGSIAIWDLATDLTQEVPLPELGTPEVYKVASARSGQVVVTGQDISTLDTMPVILDSSTLAVELLGGGVNLGGQGGLLAGADSAYLLHSSTVYKFDLAQPGTPLVASGSFPGGFSVLAPDGATLHGGGTRVDTVSLTQTGSYISGDSAFGPDGLLYVLEPGDYLNPAGSIVLVDPVTTQELAVADPPCALDGDPLRQSIAVAATGETVIVGESQACVVPTLDFRQSFLRVTTSPAVPAVITVDGLARDTWGLDWAELNAVNGWQVCFGDVVGFATPPCEFVLATRGGTTAVEGVYEPRGELRVTTDPPVASTISVDGIPRNDWGVWGEFAPGQREVCFGAVEGYDAPPCEMVEVVAGALVAVTGTFEPSAAAGAAGHGYLRVTTEPAVPSLITIDGEPADRWALTWLKLTPGFYQVCFGDVGGWSTPPCRDVFVEAGETTAAVGDFDQLGSLRVATSFPRASTIVIDGEPRDDWGVWTDIAPGLHEVCWQRFDGFAPPCQTVDVPAGGLVGITGQWPS